MWWATQSCEGERRLEGEKGLRGTVGLLLSVFNPTSTIMFIC